MGVLRKFFDRFGAPAILRCDNGSEFKGEVIQVCEEFDVKMIRGRSYHPKTQGKVSIFHILKTHCICLMILKSENSHKAWLVKLAKKARKMGMRNFKKVWPGALVS